MRRRARIDANHLAVVRALRQVGASVQSLADLGSGCPDLLVGFRGQNILFEVKDETQKPSRRRLTSDEQLWHQTWAGQVMVVESPEEAIRALERKETTS